MLTPKVTQIGTLPSAHPEIRVRPRPDGYPRPVLANPWRPPVSPRIRGEHTRRAA